LSTLAVAELTERACCGLELDPKYVDVIVRRWQDLSGKKATLEADGRSFEEIVGERKSGQDSKQIHRRLVKRTAQRPPRMD
jgi:hypothetical protein